MESMYLSKLVGPELMGAITCLPSYRHFCSVPLEMPTLITYCTLQYSYTINLQSNIICIGLFISPLRLHRGQPHIHRQLCIHRHPDKVSLNVPFSIT